MSAADVEQITLCRWVPDAELAKGSAVLVTGIRKGRRNKGPYRVQIDGVTREYPRNVWVEVEE